ncbi:MAG: hypothetical protein GEU75_13530 [Dehalococcoidia bacterium]|nr:hypothetical protein [Dehalococcoidia bacterium]
MKSPICFLGFHSWPRLHGAWRDPVMQPAYAHCRHCHKPLHSVWRTVYPQDGSSCPASCRVHSVDRASHVAA